jgi:hypothetical protein
LQKEIIRITNVDNSLDSTGYTYNPFVCENTNDKVYLLSYKEANNLLSILNLDGKIEALKQFTDPISTLVPGYPIDQNILHEQPNYITHWVHRDTTTSPAIDLSYSPSTNTPIDYPYRPIKLKMHGEEADAG